MPRKRLLKSLKTAGITAAVGLGYYAFVRLTGWGIPCLFYLLTGRFCPGCGVSRMCMALLELDLEGALRSNALVLSLLPVGLVLGLRRWILYIRTGSTEVDRLETVVLIPVGLLTAAFWILRNLPSFSFLAPG